LLKNGSIWGAATAPSNALLSLIPLTSASPFSSIDLRTLAQFRLAAPVARNLTGRTEIQCSG